jgi:hypothetical protein
VYVRTLALYESTEEFWLPFIAAPNSAAQAHRKPASPGNSTASCGVPDSHKSDSLWQENDHHYAVINRKAFTLHQVLLAWSIKKTEIGWASSMRTGRSIQNFSLQNYSVETTWISTCN